ncbi:MAG: hypothetical protein EB149_07940 [Thaumarchaeota archaeon]|nr:hypothetical protein [Nitrosopumilaceae archaeon]NDF25893.1 hypothetical protein [Nitrososphaerota archaeon]NDF47242.1 hypothetical protein [Nitrosopumilaceae archaeon]
MGLSVSIGGAIIIFTISYMIMMFPSILDASTSLTNTASQRASLDDSILKSNIELSLLSSTSPSSLVSFDIKNTGSEKMWDFSKFNIIATYDGGVLSKTRYTEYLTYEKVCSGNAGKWCISSISGDLHDPGILNFDETLVASATLTHPAYSGGLVTVLISTDNGATSEKTVVIS